MNQSGVSLLLWAATRGFVMAGLNMAESRTAKMHGGGTFGFDRAITILRHKAPLGWIAVK